MPLTWLLGLSGPLPGHTAAFYLQLPADSLRTHTLLLQGADQSPPPLLPPANRTPSIYASSCHFCILGGQGPDKTVRVYARGVNSPPDGCWPIANRSREEAGRMGYIHPPSSPALRVLFLHCLSQKGDISCCDLPCHFRTHWETVPAPNSSPCLAPYFHKVAVSHTQLYLVMLW